MKRTFEWTVNDYEYGKGWRPTWIPGFNATGSYAHDILEHTENDGGTLQEELMAFGAYLVVRWESGYVGRKASMSSLEDNMSSGIADIIRESFYRETYLPEPPVTEPYDYDDTMMASVFSACERDFYWEELDIDDWDADTNAYIKALPDRICGWVRYGYRQAQERFEHANNIPDIWDEIEAKTKNITGDWEGQKLVIEVDLESANVKVTPELPDYYLEFENEEE